MNPIRMADGEREFLRQILQDDELAEEVAGADNETAVALLLRHSRIMAVKLWRNRTGADLRTAVDAVAEIEERHNISL